MRTNHAGVFRGLAAAVALVIFVIAPAAADQGTVVKWPQSPVLKPDVPNMYDGEDYPSDIDWRIVPTEPTTFIPEPNWNVADDFRSDGRPILTVRWWGSYFPGLDGTEPLPGIEEGYVLSFFSDQPADPTDPNSFSHPRDLLGTYVAPFPAVKITPTGFVDWGFHRVWEYEVNLQDTHLFHPSDIADPIAFREQAGEIYWLSVVAENGADVVPDTWEFVHNDDPIPQEHFWGWLTRPPFFNDTATQTKLLMPGGDQWVYPFWEPIRPQHERSEMSFELLTVPEPTSALLALLGGCGLLAVAARRRGRRNRLSP